jgi:hypothetical protein
LPDFSRTSSPVTSPVVDSTLYPIPSVGSSIGTQDMSDTSNEKIPDPVGGRLEPVDDEEKLDVSALDSTESIDDIQQLKKTEELEVSCHIYLPLTTIEIGEDRPVLINCCFLFSS